MDRVGDEGKRGEVENNAIASGKGRAAQWRQASAAARPAVGAGTRRWGREGGRGRGGEGVTVWLSTAGNQQATSAREGPSQGNTHVT